MSPSAGWARDLFCAISFFRVTKMVSREYSSFQFLKSENLLFSTVPLAWLTDGMLILELNFTVGGFLGYSGPQMISKK